MSQGYEIRTYLPGEEGEVVQLLELVFDGWPNFDLECTSLDHWKWKFLDNPLKIRSIVVGISDSKIIGCGHGYDVKMKIGEESLLCTYGCDLAVHPDYRRMGLMKKMREKKKELRVKNNVNIAYRVTRNPIVIKSWNRMDRPRFPQKIVNLVRIRDIDEQLQMMPVKNAWLMKRGFQMAKLFNHLRNAIYHSESRKQDMNIVQVNDFDDRIDDFWKEISNHYEFIVERRRDYLNWRYCDPRAGNFLVKQVEKDGKILGYSVLKINKIRNAYPVGFIVDVLALPNRLEVVDALAADAIKYFDSREINIISCLTLKNHPYEQVYNRYGFLDSRINVHLFYTYYGSNDDLKKLRASSKMHFTYGDIDSLPA